MVEIARGRDHEKDETNMAATSGKQAECVTFERKNKSKPSIAYNRLGECHIKIYIIINSVMPN